MDNIDFIPVASSNVESIAYNNDDETLYVKFSNGSTYSYKNVPVSEFDSLLNAASVGSYLNRNIKNSYSYEKIS